MEIPPESYGINSLPEFNLVHFDRVIPSDGVLLQRNNYWKVYLIKKGKGSHLVDFKKYSFSAESIHFILPQQAHILTGHADQQGYLIQFRDEYIEHNPDYNNFLAELYNYKLHHDSTIMHLPTRDFDTMWNLISILMHEYAQVGNTKSPIFKKYLNILFVKCTGFLTQKYIDPSLINQKDLGQYLQWRSMVELHYTMHYKIQYYASLLHLTDKKLRQVCSQYSGLLPTEYLHRRILNESKRMLIYDALSVGEVALKLNFTDTPHFSHFFKTKTGILPSKFKL